MFRARIPARAGRAITVDDFAFVPTLRKRLRGSKIAEHGGFNPDDVHVALVLSHPDLPQSVVNDPVATKQIAPTILNALGLNPRQLDAVRMENTQALPGFDR